MKLSDRERAENREALEAMSLPEKIGYVLAYYRFPLVLALIALVAAGSAAHIRLTRKEALLYAAYANLSVGDTLDSALNEGFVRFVGGNPRKTEVYLYRGLYLTEDASTSNHEYAYASQMKTMAAVANRRLDVVFMNREAYDLLSAKGYLQPLPDLLAEDPALYGRIGSALTANTVILEDNAIDHTLDEAVEYRAVTEEAVNAVRLTGFPMFARAGFSGEVYLGLVGNGRTDTALRYLDYVTGEDPADGA